MFERFTDRARRVVVLAQEEARRLNHNYIGTEHILLGLIQEGEGHAAKALEELSINIDSVRSEVVEIIGEGQQSPSGHIPFTPRAKKVLELSLREALQLGHNYIGTEHILLGLIREGEGVAAQVLKKLGAELSQVRQTVIKLISSSGEGKKPQSASTGGRERSGSGTGSAILDQFGRNLTRMAKEGKLDPVIGRSTEIERVMQILSRRTKNNPMLIAAAPSRNSESLALGKRAAIDRENNDSSITVLLLTQKSISMKLDSSFLESYASTGRKSIEIVALELSDQIDFNELVSRGPKDMLIRYVLLDNNVLTAAQLLSAFRNRDPELTEFWSMGSVLKSNALDSYLYYHLMI